MKKCKYADKYKGLVAPKCNGGKPCDECNRIWREACDRRNREQFINNHYPHITSFGKARIECFGNNMYHIKVRKLGKWHTLGHYEYSVDNTSRQLIGLAFSRGDYAQDYIRAWFGKLGTAKIVW